MIVFDEHSIKGKILNSHNNSIVRFHSNSSKKNVYCEITITANEKETVFKIYPINNKYYFNFKERVSKMFSDLKDLCGYSPVNGLYEDRSASLNLNVKYKVVFEDLTEDLKTENYHFIYAVMQEWERKQYVKRGGNFPLHHIDRNKQTYLTCFVGYPFDISFCGPVNFTSSGYLSELDYLAVYLPYPSTLTGEDLGGSVYGVNRYIASNGVKKAAAVFNNYNGIIINNHIVKIEAKEQCSGHYLKWRNPYGGWDYYLFEDNCTEKINGKISKEITQDFDTFQSERTRIVSVDTQESKTLYANRVRKEYLPTLKGLLASPKVYLYLGKKGQKPQLNDWQTIFVSNGRLQIHTSNKSFNLKLNINFPKSETL